MSEEENWEPPLEDNGITLGPEESLRREIEKSKNLKVERLQLRDEIEKLRAQNDALIRRNREFEKKVLNLEAASSEQIPAHASPVSPGKKNFYNPPRRWSVFLLIFNLLAMAALLYLLLQK